MTDKIYPHCPPNRSQVSDQTCSYSWVVPSNRELMGGAIYHVAANKYMAVVADPPVRATALITNLD